MTVGVQSMADPTWHEAHEYIAAGNIGHVLQGQTSYYRNSSVGQWRYYPLKKDMTPKTIDWDMWLGHKFDVNGVPLGPTPEDMPFDRAVSAQWRCYWPFGGGMFTDLFVHQTTHLISAMGVRYPARVVGAGGIYLEYDGRDVPDVATVVADYDEGCQVIISATMMQRHAARRVIRGHLATIKFVGGGDYMKGFEVYAQNVAGGPAKPKQGFGTPIHTFNNPKKGNATYALYENFLECVRSRNRDTLSTPELGAAAFTTVNMGVLSYRHGKVLFWDKEHRKTTDVDPGWARQLGEAQQGTRQAQPYPRLEGRRQGQHADAASVSETGRSVEGRPGSGQHQRRLGWSWLATLRRSVPPRRFYEASLTVAEHFMSPTRNAFDLTGRRALVTGASRGIGLAVAAALTQRGAAVAITGRKAESLKSVAEQLQNDRRGCACVRLPPGRPRRHFPSVRAARWRGLSTRTFSSSMPRPIPFLVRWWISISTPGGKSSR